MTRILLVEDHEELWDFLSRRLARRGFEVLLAHDGQEGVDKARAERPDVILLDMNLPDGWLDRGTHRCAAGRARRASHHRAHGAHAMSGDRGKVMEAGCDDYHPKPVDFAKLLDQIDTVLLEREDDAG
jgi:DNA-binding response OmpR family regulator